jgi:uncharacterized protein YdaU (DUF1376 family)
MTTKMRWFKFYAGDWSSDTQGLSPIAKGVYIDMLAMQWNGRRLPANVEELSAIFPALDAKVYREILQHFKEIDGWLVNERLEEEREDAKSRSENGKQAAKKKWQSKPRCDGDADANAPALPSRVAAQSQSHCYSDTETDTETEEDEEREEEGSSAPRKARAKPTDPIVWTSESSWAGITDKDREAWAIAYPAVDIDRDLVKADQYLRSNPAKAHKRKWRSFITRWFDRTQERGGNATQAPAGAARPPEQYRPFNAPEDCDPSDYHRFRTPDGRPCSPSIYLTKSGRKRFITGEWYDDVIGGTTLIPPPQTADEIALFGKISPRRGSQSDVA